MFPEWDLCDAEPWHTSDRVKAVGHESFARLLEGCQSTSTTSRLWGSVNDSPASVLWDDPVPSVAGELK